MMLGESKGSKIAMRRVKMGQTMANRNGNRNENGNGNGNEKNNGKENGNNGNENKNLTEFIITNYTSVITITT